AGRRLGAKIGFEHAQDRPKNGSAGEPELPAFCLELLGELRIEQGIEYDAGRSLHLDQDPLELLHRAHQGVNVLDRRDGRVLCGRRPRHCDQRLPGGIGNEMEMKKPGLALNHAGRPIAVNSWGRGHVWGPSASGLAGSPGVPSTLVTSLDRIGLFTGMLWRTAGPFRPSTGSIVSYFLALMDPWQVTSAACIHL